MFQNREIYDCLLRALSDLLIFLEYSGEDAVNPDAAIQAMEQLSARLLDLSEENKDKLLKDIKGMSGNYTGVKAEFISNLGEYLGLE